MGYIDWNHDGKLDWQDDYLDYQIFMESTGQGEYSSSLHDEEDEEDEDDMDYELALTGLDRDELEYMDEDERNELLEEAGLDPDDFDFY